MKSTATVALAMLLVLTTHASAGFPGWKHSGSMYLLTTPEGADLPACASVEGFPLLVRLHKDFFDFSQADAKGADIRFSSQDRPLAYQIEEWEAAKGVAVIWVRIPSIKGNARQEIKMHWGKPGAASESNGSAVFNASNGYLSVWHMHDAKDEAGTLAAVDTGTSATAGLIGTARHFPGQKGVFGGDKIPNYPAGSTSHSTEAWFRAEKPNATLIGWGNEGGGRGCKVCVQLRSPPHIRIDSDFSDAVGEARIPLGAWTHVMHTYDGSDSKIYVNGKLDVAAKRPLNIKSPSRMWIGGWYNNYHFVGDIDEARISQVARSPEWIRLQYENQKPLQKLVGPLVQPGAAFSASHEKLVLAEGSSATVEGRAGGAQKLYWILKRDGREEVVAVDRFSFKFDAGRVVGDRSLTLQFKAVYADGVKTKDIPITIREDIPEPVFELQAPAEWDGRRPIEVIPRIANLKELQAKNADKFNFTWTTADIAVIKDVVPGKLILKRAQNSGVLRVNVAIDNGGQPTLRSANVVVEEPAKEAWVQRTPAPDEKPVEGQFYARDDKNEGTLVYNGKLTDRANAVFLKIYADGKLYASESQKLGGDNSYAFNVKLKPGLIKYNVEFGKLIGKEATVLDAPGDIVCGDAYLIDGQSNAEATDLGKEKPPPFTSPWIRSFGSTARDPKNARFDQWGYAEIRSREGKAQIGCWGMDLAKRLVDKHKMPICIINGAVGGSRIDQHQRNPDDPTDVATIYGRLLWRVQQARLTNGIRGVLWHQGENDQGADGPTGGFGWETYQQYFVEMAAAWKEDFPNIQQYYTFQIWPRACAMGVNGSDNHLREVQRTLPRLFSNMSVMSTLGIKPPGGCHFPVAGYAEFARLIGPLVERDHYGLIAQTSITAPNLKRASFASSAKDEIVLEFDQPVQWGPSLASQFYLDGAKDQIVSGSASGSILRLKLAETTRAQKLTYLDSRAWSQDNLLWGANGIAALTFCDVPIQSRQ